MTAWEVLLAATDGFVCCRKVAKVCLERNLQASYGPILHTVHSAECFLWLTSDWQEEENRYYNCRITVHIVRNSHVYNLK